MASPRSIFTYVGSSSRDSCGYCSNDGGASGPSRRCSFYLTCEKLDPGDYKTLIDRGWRRSGTLLYKPHMTKSCCPQYTIRLNADTFKPSRDQRQCLHRWTRYVLGEEYIKEAALKYPKSKEEKKKAHNEFDLIESVHAPEYSTLAGRIPPQPAHKFEVTLEPSTWTKEKYDLFFHYQTKVHQERPSEVSQTGFKRFLCVSPITTTTTPAGQKLGTYHQCYRLDGRLIAVGVLDLLPGCVSGVYFMYHTDFAKWHLGKVSACREAALAVEGGYGHYYMGYYIHSCIKMRYKGDFPGQQLLDPVSHEWNLLDDLRPHLDVQEYYSPYRAAHPACEDPAFTQSDGPAEEDADADEGNGIHPPGFLARSRMPGIMTPAELAAFDLGATRLRVDGTMHEATDFTAFYSPDPSIRSIFEDTVAAVGPEVAQGMALSF